MWGDRAQPAATPVPTAANMAHGASTLVAAGVMVLAVWLLWVTTRRTRRHATLSRRRQNAEGGRVSLG